MTAATEIMATTAAGAGAPPGKRTAAATDSSGSESDSVAAAAAAQRQRRRHQNPNLGRQQPEKDRDTVAGKEINDNCKSQASENSTNNGQMPSLDDHDNGNDGEGDGKTATAEDGLAMVRSGDVAALKKEIGKRVVRQKLKKQRHLVVEGAFDSTYLDALFPRMLALFEPQPVRYNGGVANVPDWKISCYLEVMDGYVWYTYYNLMIAVLWLALGCCRGIGSVSSLGGNECLCSSSSAHTISGVPTTNPNHGLLDLFRPLLDQCDDLFLYWYRQQHACNNATNSFWTKKRNGVTNSISATQPTTNPPPPSSSLSCRRLMTFITRYTPKPGEQALLKVSRNLFL